MYCPRCDNVGRDGAFCEDCGTKTIDSKVQCPYCKEDIYRCDKFCPECGKPIQEEGGGKKTNNSH